MPFGQKGIAHLALILLVLAGVVIGIFLIQNPQIFSPKADEVSSNVVAVHTLEAPDSGWYWIDSQAEITSLVAKYKYKDEGVLFFAYPNGNIPGTVPLYRLIKRTSQLQDFPGLDSWIRRVRYSPVIFLTTSQAESNLMINNNIPRDPDPWIFKDAALYVYPPGATPPAGSTPVYRLIRTTPAEYQYDYIYHYFTNNQKEVADLMATGKYRNDGIAFYGVPSSSSSTNPLSVPVPSVSAVTPPTTTSFSGDSPSSPGYSDQINPITSSGIQISLQRNICDNGLPNLEFSWNPIPGSDTYYILRTLPGQPEESLAHTTTAAFGDTPNAQNGLVKYSVSAGTGNNIIASGEISIQTKNCVN